MESQNGWTISLSPPHYPSHGRPREIRPSRPMHHLVAAKSYGDSLWNSSFPSPVSLPIIQEASLAVLLSLFVTHLQHDDTIQISKKYISSSLSPEG